MSLTEMLQRAQNRMLDAAAQEEERIAGTLPLSRFCGKGCRSSFASDIRTGLVAGLPNGDGCCAYCEDELNEHTP